MSAEIFRGAGCRPRKVDRGCGGPHFGAGEQRGRDERSAAGLAIRRVLRPSAAKKNATGE